MLDFLDTLLGDPSYAPNSSAPVVPPTQATAQATQASSPSTLDLMAAAGNPAAPAPKADTSALPGLTLLQFASSIAQPRGYGQSTAAKFLQSAAGAAAYNMTERKAMEDRVIEQELQKRRLAATDAALENAKLGNIKTRQDITQTEQRAPLELTKLKLAIDGAQSENELTALKLRVGKIKEQYTRQEVEAALAERAAKTDEHKGDAMMKRAHAQLFQRQADELVNLAEIRSKAGQRPDYQLKEGMPGEPAQVVDKRSGMVYRSPMSPSDALDYAKRQVNAMKEVEPFKSKDEEKLAVQRLYREGIAGNLPRQGEVSQGTDTTTAAPAPGQKAPEMDKDYKEMLLRTSQYPNSVGVYADPKSGKITVVKGGNVDMIYPNRAAFDKDYTIENGKPVKRTMATATQDGSVAESPNKFFISGPGRMPPGRYTGTRPASFSVTSEE